MEYAYILITGTYGLWSLLLSLPPMVHRAKHVTNLNIFVGEL